MTGESRPSVAYFALYEGENGELVLEKGEHWHCVYCGREVPAGIPHPSVFSCCGEVGHVEEDEEQEWLNHMRQITENKQ